MRNGDLYKMQRLLKTGTSMDEIYRHFGRAYSREEIDRHLTPSVKKTTKKTAVKKDAQRSDDMQPGAAVAGGK